MSTIEKRKAEDATIIEAFLLKDEKVLVQWYDKMKPSFMNLCKKKNVEQDIGLDIYQDAVSSLYLRIREKRMPELKDGGLEGYLMHVCRNKIVDHIRKNVNFEDPMMKQELLERTSQYTIIDLPDTDMSAEQVSLSSGLKELGKRCYEVIKLFYYEGLSISEIKEYMKYKDTNTVKALKSRCMKQLRKQIRK